MQLRKRSSGTCIVLGLCGEVPWHGCSRNKSCHAPAAHSYRNRQTVESRTALNDINIVMTDDEQNVHQRPG
jgi:hypothetical protein